MSEEGQGPYVPVRHAMTDDWGVRGPWGANFFGRDSIGYAQALAFCTVVNAAYRQGGKDVVSDLGVQGRAGQLTGKVPLLPSPETESQLKDRVMELERVLEHIRDDVLHTAPDSLSVHSSSWVAAIGLLITSGNV